MSYNCIYHEYHNIFNEGYNTLLAELEGSRLHIASPPLATNLAHFHHILTACLFL